MKLPGRPHCNERQNHLLALALAAMHNTQLRSGMNISYNALHCRSSWSYDDKKPGWPAPSLGPRPPHTQLSQGCPTLLRLLATLHCVIRTPGLTYKAEQGRCYVSLCPTVQCYTTHFSLHPGSRTYQYFPAPPLRPPSHAQRVLCYIYLKDQASNLTFTETAYCYFHFLFPVIISVVIWLNKTLTFAV